MGKATQGDVGPDSDQRIVLPITADRAPAPHNAGAARGRRLPRRPRPALRRVESNDANWIAILAVQQIRDDAFEAGGFNVSLAP